MRKKKLLIVVLLFGVTMAGLLPAYNIFILQPSIFKTLIENTEQNAANAARLISRSLFLPQSGRVLQNLSPAQQNSIDRLLDDLRFFKIKIYSPQGRTIYSTDAEDIGQVNDKKYFRQDVAKGVTLSKVVQNSQPFLDGTVISRDVVETCVPIINAGHFAGALEIYFDITKDTQALKSAINRSSTFLVLVTCVFLVLLAAIAARERQAIDKQILAEQELHNLAYFDKLTELPNRSLFHDRLAQALTRARRDGAKVAILYFNLDHFKEVNDSFDHKTGDALLKRVAQRLQRLVRQSDSLARIGGDEFAYLMTTQANDHAAALVAEKILEAMQEPFEFERKTIVISASIGISISPNNGEDAEALQKHADIAMYAAKEQGGNTYAYYTEEMNRQSAERRQLLTAIRQAMDNDEFFLVYQPQLDLSSGRIVCVEALLRWNHPQRGLVSPAQFLPLAEDAGLIGPLGDWVLNAACRQNKAWQDAGLPRMRIAVNISANQLKQPDFIYQIDYVLQESGLDPWWLELELMENVVMENAESSKELLAEISKRGIHLTIDDFGTGYSSLSSLKDFIVDRIKIDRSFVAQVPFNHNDTAIVETILAMARILKLEVVAGGVETGEQLRFLKERGCQGGQGYYLGRPMAAEEFVEHLDTFAEQVHSSPVGLVQQARMQSS